MHTSFLHDGSTTVSSGEPHAMPIVPESQEASTPSLCEVSSKDRSWDVHRYNTDVASSYYKATEEYNGYAQRMDFCSDLLQFGLVPDTDVGTGELKLKLRSARFCRVRTCDVCQWRRSLMWKAKAHKVIPKLVNDYPTARWLFLTLTVKNCHISELRSTLAHMKTSFARMADRKAWPALGYVRATEVTRKEADGTAHPHFHCLLMVNSNYFKGRGYIKQKEWQSLWRSCTRLDYDPVVDVRAVKKVDGAKSAIPEVFKYCTKSGDLLADRDWFLEYTRQMHNTRSISTGGILKTYLRELEEEPEDLIGKDEEEQQFIDDEMSLYFGWKRQEKKYKLTD